MSGPLGCAIHLRTGKINPPLEYIPLALAGKNEVGGVRWRVEKERFGGRGTAKMVASTLAFGAHIELGPGPFSNTANSGMRTYQRIKNLYKPAPSTALDDIAA
jgi:hypothetical protein